MRNLEPGYSWAPGAQVAYLIDLRPELPSVLSYSCQGQSCASRKRPRSYGALSDDPEWYKDALIYELHVRAFADSNGDGIGDFAGLLAKLDYLADLGVTALWLLPFYPSPLRDGGYDIADYYGVNPSYGSLEDFKSCLGRCPRARHASDHRARDQPHFE